MSDLSIRFNESTNDWQFVDAGGKTTNFSAATHTSPFVANSLPSRANNFDIAVSGCSQTATVKVALHGPSVPLTWVPSDGSDVLIDVIATCGTVTQSGYVKVKRSGG
jgi:hypothetical protein